MQHTHSSFSESYIWLRRVNTPLTAHLGNAGVIYRSNDACLSLVYISPKIEQRMLCDSNKYIIKYKMNTVVLDHKDTPNKEI